jgi:glucose-1-phosphate cytidylyltransferase
VKTVVLCGGLGTRLTEETQVRPKPMVEIGGRPILWHVLQIYRASGFREFVLALGYKGEVVKDYFLNYRYRHADLVVDLKAGSVTAANHPNEDWIVHLIDTGVDCMTGGRLHRLAALLGGGGTFMLTYGDGVADIDVRALVAFHRSHGRLATVTAVRPPARFGNMVLDGDVVGEFREKPQAGEGWINGGFMVFEPGVFRYLRSDADVLERELLECAAKDAQLMAFRHDGFWHCMDTLRDRQSLERMWEQGEAPWKVW